MKLGGSSIIGVEEVTLGYLVCVEFGDVFSGVGVGGMARLAVGDLVAAGS